MTNFIRLAMAAILVAGMITVTGCGGVTEEQLAQLDALREEVTALSKETNALKSEKTKLEREIAEQKAKLDECNKLKADTEANLKKIGK